MLVSQSCPALCEPMECHPSGSSVRGILQARILEWVAVSFSRDLPDPGIERRSPTLQADSLPSEPPGQSNYLYKDSVSKSGHTLRHWGSGLPPHILEGTQVGKPVHNMGCVYFHVKYCQINKKAVMYYVTNMKSVEC